MKIEWNKVTWYSKVLAVILAVLIFYIGFILGAERTEVVREEIDANSLLKENQVDLNRTIIKDGKYCFFYKEGATKETPYSTEEHIILNIKNMSVVGTKSGVQKGVDMTNDYTGALKGNINGNTLELFSSFMANGSDDKELEIYKMEKDSLVKMRWPLKEENDVLIPLKISEPKITTYYK